MYTFHVQAMVRSYKPKTRGNELYESHCPMQGAVLPHGWDKKVFLGSLTIFFNATQLGFPMGNTHIIMYIIIILLTHQRQANVDIVM